AASARASEIRGHHQDTDRERCRDHDAKRAGDAPGQRLTHGPRGADEKEEHDRGLRASHATDRRCTNKACLAHSPHCESSSFVTHSLLTAKRSSSRSVVCSISGPSVLKLKCT